MSDLRQRTLKTPVSVEGIGLHSGAPVRLRLWPAPADSGLTFIRSDLPGAPEIPARFDNVVDNRLATTLGRDGVRIGTVEHLLSAAFGLGIDNLRVGVEGPELPILDGSAEPFSQLLRSGGIEIQRRPRRFLIVRRPLEIRDGDRYCQVFPAREFSVRCTVDFDHALIRDQEIEFSFGQRRYEREIARARTFALRRDVEALQKVGLAKGGSLENAIVVDDFHIVNPEGLRYADEFVRHKVLDLLGDLALCGGRLIGRVVAYKSGHALHHRLVRALCSAGDAVETVEARADRQLALKLGPLTGLVPGQA